MIRGMRRIEQDSLVKENRKERRIGKETAGDEPKRKKIRENMKWGGEEKVRGLKR